MTNDRRSIAIRQTLAAGAVLVGGLLVLGHCIGCLTPKQASDVTDASCKTVEALAPDATVESICAFAPELAAIAALVMASRADGGPARMAVRSCVIIPTTTTCATNAETLAAIRAVKVAR